MDALNLSEVTYPSIQDVPSLGEGSGQVKSMPLVTCQENLNQTLFYKKLFTSTSLRLNQIWWQKVSTNFITYIFWFSVWILLSYKRILAVTSPKAITIIIKGSATFCPIAGLLTSSCATCKIHWTGKKKNLQLTTKVIILTNSYKLND